MTAYSRSTLVGYPSRGPTIIIPYIPDAMCSSTIGVPQWYMNTPG
jgi:hypothetical protein